MGIRKYILDNIPFLVAAVLTLVFLIYPYNVSSFNDSEQVEYWYAEWRDDRNDPNVEYLCSISTNYTIWNHEENYTIDFHISGSFKVAEVGIRTLNVTRLVLRLFVGPSYIPLLNHTYTPQLMLPNITSLDEPIIRYDLHIPFNVTLDDYRFIHTTRGPKIQANLAFVVFLNSDENQEWLSNYYNPGYSEWTPREIQIVIDEPLSRVSQILSILSILLIPGILYSFGRWSEKRGSTNIFQSSFQRYQHKLFYLGLSFFGVFLSIVFGLVHGPSIFYTNRAWMDTFSGLVIIIVGFSITLIVPGFMNENSIEVDTTIHSNKYREITQVIGLRYRTRDELSESGFAWDPQEEPHKLRLATSRYELLILLIISSSLLFGIYQVPASNLLHIVSAVLLGMTSYLFLLSAFTKFDIYIDYTLWRDSTISYWTVFYIFVAPIEILLDFYNPLRRFRSENPSQMSDYDSLRNVLTPGMTRNIKSHQTPEAIQTASTVWFYRTHLIPILEENEDTLFKDKINDILEPLRTMSSVWSHTNGSEFLLRRIAFAFNLMSLYWYSQELAYDCSELVLNTQISSNLTSPQIVSLISNNYTSISGLPSSVKMKYLQSLMSFRIVWILLSFLLASPLSGIIWSFI